MNKFAVEKTNETNLTKYRLDSRFVDETSSVNNQPIDKLTVLFALSLSSVKTLRRNVRAGIDTYFKSAKMRLPLVCKIIYRLRTPQQKSCRLQKLLELVWNRASRDQILRN